MLFFLDLTFLLFFLHHTPTTEIYTLSLHDALPICLRRKASGHDARRVPYGRGRRRHVRRAAHRRLQPAVRAAGPSREDRKSTRLNSSHVAISYAVFCLKKKQSTPRAGAADA